MPAAFGRLQIHPLIGGRFTAVIIIIIIRISIIFVFVICFHWHRFVLNLNVGTIAANAIEHIAGQLSQRDCLNLLGSGIWNRLWPRWSHLLHIHFYILFVHWRWSGLR